MASFKYHAFISYSHADKAWGDWLHRGLERYRVPRAIIGKTTERGETVPARVFPVFRDREELPTAVDLGAVIISALRQSNYLIVICSPNSAKSQWVNQEILQYKQLGRENRVLAIIVDGEPNAADGKPGFAPEQECFPEALKYKIGPNGELTKERTEPIAADARAHADGKPNALIKLLAGVLGVNYDELKRRDEEAARRRQRVALGLTGTVALVIAGFAVAAWIQRNHAIAERKRADANALEAEHQRNEAVQERKRAEDNFRQALMQQGRNHLDRARSEFSQRRLHAAYEASRAALGNLETPDGILHRLLPVGTPEQRAAALIAETTGGHLVYQASTSAWKDFFVSCIHERGKQRVYGSMGRKIHAIDVKTQATLWVAELAEDPEWIASSADSETIYVHSESSVFALAAVDGRVLHHASQPSEHPVRRMVGGMDHILIYVSQEGQLVQWNLTDGTPASAVSLPEDAFFEHFTPETNVVHVATRSGDVWVADLGKPSLMPVFKRAGPLAHASVSQDHRTMVLADVDGTITRHKLADGGIDEQFTAPEAKPLLALDASDGELFILDVEGNLGAVGGDGRVDFLQRLPVSRVMSLGVSRDEDLVVAMGVAAFDHPSNIFRASLRGEAASFAPFGQLRDFATFAASTMHPSGAVVLTLSNDRLQLLNLVQNKVVPLKTLEADERVVDMTIAATGMHLATLNANGLLHIYGGSGDGGEKTMTLDGVDMRSGRMLAFTSDGSRIYALTNQGLLEIEIESGTTTILMPPEESAGIHMIAACHLPGRLFMASFGRLAIYNTATRQFERTFTHPGVGYFADVKFDQDFLYVAANGNGGCLLVLQPSDFSVVGEFSASAQSVNTVLPLWDGRVGVIAQDDAVLWDISNLRRKQHRNTEDALPRSGWYYPSADGQLLLADHSYADAVLKVDPSSGTLSPWLEHGDFPAPPGGAFIRDEIATEHPDVLVLTDGDGFIRVYDRANRELVSRFKPAREPWKIAAATTRPAIASMDRDGNPMIHDWNGNVLLSGGVDLPAGMRSIRWSADSRLCILSGGGRAVAVDAMDGRLVHDFEDCRELKWGTSAVVILAQKGGRLRCLDADTLEERWISNPDRASFFEGFHVIEAEKMLLVWDNSGTISYLDLKDGSELLTDMRWPKSALEERHMAIAGRNGEYLIANHAMGGSYWHKRFILPRVRARSDE